ncbi:gamma-glutamyltransferase family protein [Pseudonocardia phyllosphaerae]|uniref:gamma-glutamyltransferase family protein n=1 Tax=Pseudonocardia phyllosphaerae TaxID=3390502 RepID=UPI003979CF76
MRRTRIAACLLVAGLGLTGCADVPASGPGLPAPPGAAAAAPPAPAPGQEAPEPGGPPPPGSPPCTSPTGANAAPGSAGAAQQPGVPGAPEIATGYRSGMTDVRTRSFAVSTANPLSTRAACEVLAKGGTAADAAVVAQTVLGLVEPQSSGLGGGGYLLHWDARARRLQTYDGRETAPAAADGDYLTRTSPTDPAPPRPDARASGRSIGVPGAMRMLEKVHDEHGRTPWAELMRPASTLARNGFPISPRMADSIASSRDGLAADPPSKAYFLGPDGAPKPAGTPLRNPALADTLDAVGRRGADALHTGPIADAIVAAARDTTGGRTPSLLTADDLARYRPVERDAVCVPHGPHQVCGAPPSSSGGTTVAAALRILETLRIEQEKPAPAGPDGATPTPRAAHLIAEAERLAYADRDRYVADPAFVPLPGQGADTLLDRDYLRGRAALVRPQGSLGTAPAGNLGPVPRGDAPDGPENGTSQISIVDRYGDAVSFTTSVESGFGSFHMVGGFLLNNQLTDFSPVPRDADGTPVANRVQPGKRPRSSMAPTLVFGLGPDGRRGDLQYVTGSPGGGQIPQFVVKTLVQALDWGATPQQAVSAIDLGAQNKPETGVGGEHPDVHDGDPLVTGLRGLGQQVSVAPQSSGLSMLGRTPGGWAGGADPRREGVVLGDTG